MAFYTKPKNMKYTDLCIFIDQHLPEIAEPGKNPELEETIFKYIYCIVFTLAYKSGYFINLDDYDNFALFGATELFLSVRRKQQNAGQEIRGRIVVPVKSILNFTKAVLFPLKVQYQNSYFEGATKPHSEINMELEQSIKSTIKNDYAEDMISNFEYAFEDFHSVIKHVLKRSPLYKDKLMYHRLYISVLLTLNYYVTLPNKLKKQRDKINAENIVNENFDRRILTSFNNVAIYPQLWHLGPEYASYVHLLSIETIKGFSMKLGTYIHDDELREELLTDIVRSAYDSYGLQTDLGE